METPTEIIDWNDFSKIEMRVGTILRAEEFKEAKKPAYILHIDFGPLGTRKTSAQITQRYTVGELPGKQVVAVLNFPPKQIATIRSECLVLGCVGDDHGVTLLTTGSPVQNGLRIG